MQKIVYIPLDERPVNYDYPLEFAKDAPEIEVISPPRELLGLKKEPALLNELWAWLNENIVDADYLLASLDQLIYGGIVPSRLHQYDQTQAESYLELLVKLKEINPELKIYAFNLIMRVPAYSSDDEEPDYYADYGAEIFRWGWLKDKFVRQGASTEEEKELEQILATIPEHIQKDYLRRRNLNHFVNRKAIQLVADKVLDFLVIPLDDCAEFGFSAAEQKELLKLIEKDSLQQQIHIYPGADEVGCTLLTRIYNHNLDYHPRVFVRYSSTSGPTIIPRYEDRPLGESIKSQITVCGGIMVDSSLEADLILMVNSPTLGGLAMQEAAEAIQEKDTSYYSFRNLREFIASLGYYLERNAKVALADVAFGNGSDHELMRLLAKEGVLGHLCSYGAWNTPGNTIGTVLAHALLRLKREPAFDKFLLDRYMEDWGYQALVRNSIRERAEALNITYFDLNTRQDEIRSLALQELREFQANYLGEFKECYYLEDVYFPWNRLFEIGLNSKLR